MLGRLVVFLFCLLAGGTAGAWAAGWPGALAGVVAGALAWLALDLVRAARLLKWLRRDGSAEPPRAGGAWGEAAERVRRALRAREQQVQAADARLQEFLAAIQASPNGVLLLDAQGRIEWCNATAAGQLGIDPVRDQLQLVGNLLRDPAFAAYNAGGDYSQDVVIAGRDSAPGRPLRLSVRLHPYGPGRKLLLSRDITALEQAEAMRRDFVANVSHEVRTPLTVLAGFIETLQTLELAEPERRRYLELMAQQAGRMQTLVSDLLTLSRLEGSPWPGTDEWTPAATLTAACEQEARSLSALLGKAHALSVPPAPPLELAGHPSELQSALSNLVSNAVRYTPAGGRIQLRWQPLADGRLEVAVQDNGPGIAPEHLPRLTERFYRVDRSRSRETGGTGLGLAIVKHVAHRHGAELRIASTPGAGSTFALVFPPSRVRALRPPSDAAGARPATAAP